MTNEKKKTPKVKVVNNNTSPTIVEEQTMSIAGTIVALDAQALRAIAVNSAATLFSAPQFTREASPQNILGMADLLYKYISGEVKVNKVEGEEQKFA